jgi:hypothetical protein
MKQKQNTQRSRKTDGWEFDAAADWQRLSSRHAGRSYTGGTAYTY